MSGRPASAGAAVEGFITVWSLGFEPITVGNSNLKAGRPHPQHEHPAAFLVPSLCSHSDAPRGHVQCDKLGFGKDGCNSKCRVMLSRPWPNPHRTPTQWHCPRQHAFWGIAAGESWLKLQRTRNSKAHAVIAHHEKRLTKHKLKGKHNAPLFTRTITKRSTERDLE